MTIISRRIIPAAVAALLASSSSAQAQLKVGTVDINRVIQQHGKTKEAEAKLNEAKNAAKKEFDERADSYKKALDELKRMTAQLEAPALNAEAKSAKAKERDEKIAAIRTMEREITEFRTTREQQLQQQVIRMRDAIVTEVTDVVMERVKANNMDLVFDKSGASLNGFSPVLFSRESADFTGEVIAALPKSAEAARPTVSPAPAKSTKP